MIDFDLTLQERHLEALRELTSSTDGVEGAAYILCGVANIARDPWGGRARRRLSSFEVIPIPQEGVVSASYQHITWSTDSFVRLLRRAKDEGLVPGIVHTHPSGPDDFSDQDHRNERELAVLTQNRNGPEAELVSILLTGAISTSALGGSDRGGFANSERTRTPTVRAQLWRGTSANPVPAGAVRVIGRRLEIQSELATGDLEAFDRQALAFGPELTARLRSLRIGIVGCGGTGSATALLLARLGVGQIVLFDDDIVEITNLNRLHGSRRSDAENSVPKVHVIEREITEMGLGTRVVPLRRWVGHPECRNALKSCDVIFGCTDDHDGRLLLNRFAYFYSTPVIDMGLAIDPGPDARHLRDLQGRVTVLVPSAPCLLCRGIVDPIAAREEILKRSDPTEFERQKQEAYVRGSGNPSPAVVTFTTATACLAVDELIQGLTGFRTGERGWAWQRTRRFDRLEDRRPGCLQDPNCPICVDTAYWGRGDVTPFLDRTG